MLKFHYERAAEKAQLLIKPSLAASQPAGFNHSAYLNPWPCVDTGCWQMLKFHYERAAQNTSC